MRARARRDARAQRARTLLKLLEDVLVVREPVHRCGRVSGHNIFYRTEQNPKGTSLHRPRVVNLPTKQNIEAAYVLADALEEEGGKRTRLAQGLTWFMNVFEDWYRGDQAIPLSNVLEPSEWNDFGYLIGDLTRELTGLL